MTEPICPELVTASILVTSKRQIHQTSDKVRQTLKCFMLQMEGECAPLEVFFLQEQDEFPELALILLH